MTGGKGAFGKVSAVRFERLFAQSAARVWEFLVTPAHMPGWFGEGVIEPRIGGAVTFMGGHIKGVVTQWDPPHKLAYTWNVFSPGEARSPYPESYLSLTLAPRGEDVLLALDHLPVLERFEKQNAMGWHTYLDMLTDALNGAPPQPRRVYMERNAALYGVDLNALAR